MNIHKSDSMNTRKKGALREEAAALFLSQHGFKVTDRNFYSRQGEIDIIGWDGNELVFVEVKYRRSQAHGVPSEAVTPAKQQKIRKTASFYIYTQRIPDTIQVRFDVVEIVKLEGERHHIHWIRNAFW